MIPIILRLQKSSPEVEALVAAVNQGIDAHLTALVSSKFDDCGRILQATLGSENDIRVLTRRLRALKTPASRKLIRLLKARLALPALDEFTAAYIVCALGTSSGKDDRPLEETCGPEDIHSDHLARMAADCAQFQATNAQLLATAMSGQDKLSCAGHDFWLTRNHHGAGFWDGDWAPDAIGKQLTTAAHAFSEVDLYVGDDGKLYLT